MSDPPEMESVLLKTRSTLADAQGFVSSRPSDQRWLASRRGPSTSPCPLPLSYLVASYFLDFSLGKVKKRSNLHTGWVRQFGHHAFDDPLADGRAPMPVRDILDRGIS